MGQFWGALLWLGCMIAIIWCAWWLGTRNARKAKLKAKERQEMHHVVGSSRRWWKQPPGDPPEGDY